jgi:hypothetical protein
MISLFYNAITGFLYWSITVFGTTAIQYCAKPIKSVSKRKGTILKFWVEYDDY